MRTLRGKETRYACFRIGKSSLASSPSLLRQWEADYVVDYLFNGRPVTNHIHTKLTVSPTSGLIIKQEDTFDFYAWSKQSLGVVGTLLGWTEFMKNKVRATARSRLEHFAEKDAAATATSDS
jgi:hypothetical protein